MRALLLADARPYSIWEWDAWRLHNLWLALGATSDGVYGTMLAVMTDRLRDHSVIALANFAGDIADVAALLMLVDHSQRLVWAASLSQVVRFRSEPDLLDADGDAYLARERFFSAGLTLRHPFDRFTHVQTQLNLGGATASLSESTRAALDPDLLARWDRDEGGQRLRAELSLALGHTTIQYHRATGPFRGGSILAEVSLGFEPWHDAASSGIRLDAELFVPLIGASNLGLRAGLGASWTWDGAPREVMLSSYEILRAVPIGDVDFLVGRHYAFALAELQVPLVTFSTLPLFDIEGLVGLDFGAAAPHVDRLWEKRVLGVALGLGFGFGPLVLRCTWAVPIDIGAPVPNGGDWTSHVALGWRYQ